MKPPQFRTLRQRMLDPRNRRSRNVEDRRGPDITLPIPLPYDPTVISPHERDVARYRAEDALTDDQVDEVPRTVRRKRSRVLR